MRLLLTTLVLMLISLSGFGCAPYGAEPEPSALAFLPEDPESWEAFEVVAERFERVSGVHLDASMTGIPIFATPRPRGVETCGETQVNYWRHTGEVESISIRVWFPIPDDCYPNLSDTLTHEVIHGIRSSFGFDLDPGKVYDAPHSPDGVFSMYAQNPRFDASSLEKLCEAVDCPLFAPEP